MVSSEGGAKYLVPDTYQPGWFGKTSISYPPKCNNFEDEEGLKTFVSRRMKRRAWRWDSRWAWFSDDVTGDCMVGSSES